MISSFDDMNVGSETLCSGYTMLFEANARVVLPLPDEANPNDVSGPESNVPAAGGWENWTESNTV